MELFKSYPINNSYEVGNNGTIKYKGKIIRKGIKDKPILVNLVSTAIIDMVTMCFKESGTGYKLTDKLHHRKDVNHTAETKRSISDAKLKKVVIKGVEYRGISTAAKELNVNRSTIYRYLRNNET